MMMNPPISVAHLCAGQSGDGQDRVAIRDDAGGSVVIVVADGVGGMGGGAEAADFVVERAMAGVTALGASATDLSLANLLSEIDAALSGEPHGGQSTAIVAAVNGEDIAGAYVGDSEAWLIFADGEFQLASAGRPRQFVGEGHVSPMTFTAELGRGTLVVATDGLWKYASLERVLSIARAPDQKVTEVCERLYREALPAAGGLWDDIAIVVCRTSVC